MGDRGQHRHERWLREPGGRLRLPLAPAWRWDLAVGVGLLAVTALVLLLGR
ncbi:MAG: hypothetical protein KKI08_00005 [Armatimonadetes bacterium]|nr:hypothetical protein [Armatimonadota bacterium]